MPDNQVGAGVDIDIAHRLSQLACYYVPRGDCPRIDDDHAINLAYQRNMPVTKDGNRCAKCKVIGYKQGALTSERAPKYLITPYICKAYHKGMRCARSAHVRTQNGNYCFKHAKERKARR